MGLADYGLAVDASGSIQASVLNTTRLRGEAELNASGIQPLDLYNTASDAYSLQLNAVLANTVLFGGPGYEFWCQDVFEFFPSERRAAFVSNIWNLSGSSPLGAAIYEHGPNGTRYADVYVAETLLTNITYPFDLALYLNSTLLDGRDAVSFSGTLSGPGEFVRAPFDYAVFNSTAPQSAPLSAPAEFSANGMGYDPAGLTNDFELVLGGPGGGSQASLFAANADLGLAYWNPDARRGVGGYSSIPSAFTYGGETGETASGATVTWSDLPGGPGDLATYGVMRTGPSFLEGLWNASGPEGSFPVTVRASPANAFEVVTPSAPATWTDESPLLSETPGFLLSHAEAYYPPLGVTVLFGGYDGLSGAASNETWWYSAGSWTEKSYALEPPARWGATLAYDAEDGYLVLFGGQAHVRRSGFLSDTWVYDESGWHRLSPSRSPSPRAYAAMTYDAAASEIVLFGGGLGVRGPHWALFNDTWTFTGGVWTNISTSAGVPPPASVRAGIAYDAADGYVLLLGGSWTGNESVACPYDQAGEWTFAGGRWARLSPTGAEPPAGEGALWFDPSTETTYFLEGAENATARHACDAYVGDLWGYSGGSWRLLRAGDVAGSPPPRVLMTVVYDAADHVNLLFGGQVLNRLFLPYLDDTWTVNLTGASSPPRLLTSEPAIGPTVSTETFWLAPGNYTVLTELSGYDPVTTTLDVQSTSTLQPTLVPDASRGIYTPLWAWTNAQVAALSTSGAGTPSAPYVLENQQGGVLAPLFLLLNDYALPTYPGLFLLDTNVATEVVNPATFLTAWPAVTTLEYELPFWFWNVTNVALVGGVNLGSLTDPNWPFTVVFYDSAHNLIAGNMFRADGFALEMETGPQYGRFTGPGGGNTIWGNTFGFSQSLPNALVKLLELEGSDLIYNNWFPGSGLQGSGSGGADTACQPGLPEDQLYACWPVYSAVPVEFSSAWNISVQPATEVHYAAGFPYYPLTGSIADTKSQGGNWWWSYGTTWPNAYGVLPFEAVWAATNQLPTFLLPAIQPGGDYAPLVQGALYQLKFVVHGLPSGASWEVNISESSTTFDLFRTNATSHTVELPNGTFSYAISASGGYGLPSPRGTLEVHGISGVYPLDFLREPFFVATFQETGLPPQVLSRHGWSVELNGTALHGYAPTLEIATTEGLSAELVTGPSGYASNAAHQLDLLGNLSVAVTFVKARTYDLTFQERGLPTRPSPQRWCVEVDGDSRCAVAGAVTRYDNLTAGTYAYAVVSPLAGQTIAVTVGKIHYGVAGSLPVEGRTKTVVKFAYRYAVAFTQSGLPPGEEWTVTLGGVYESSTGATITFNESNGTYRFRVSTLGPSRLSPSAGKLSVQGASVTVNERT
jgi:Thermopsin/Galactose oxidase, central domain